MKRFSIASLTIVLSLLAMSTIAEAKQVNINDTAADLNKDGTVTITELAIYNRDQRNN